MSLGMRFPQNLACDGYSRHHRMLREKRLNAGGSHQKAEFCSFIDSPCTKGDESKLEEERRMQFDEKNNETSKKCQVSRNRKSKAYWNILRTRCCEETLKQRSFNDIDSVDWYAVMRADVEDISEAILSGGMNKKLSLRIKELLNRLVVDHGNLDLEWLRAAAPEDVKEFLLSIYGLGLKSAECVQLLTFQQRAFPVDVNVARVAVRLGWVPAPSVSDEFQMCLLEQDSKIHDLIHGCLWPRLSKLEPETLYQLHYHMITFGKVFCTKQKPNCSECPLKVECKYYSNAASREKPDLSRDTCENTASPLEKPTPCLRLGSHSSTCMLNFKELDIEDYGRTQKTPSKVTPSRSSSEKRRKTCEGKEPLDICSADFVEGPNTPVKDQSLRHDKNTIKGNISTDVRQPSKSKTRTKHLVYELPDWHPILESFDDRDPSDPSPYLLVTWETGEHDFQKSTEFLASSVKGSQAVSGTIMIPYKTGLKGTFPLNGTYFQTNEVLISRPVKLLLISLAEHCLDSQGKLCTVALM